MYTRRNNASIKRDVEAQLEWDARIDTPELSVDVENGHVTLSGTVQSYKVLNHVAQDAWQVPGVLTVTNDANILSPEFIELPDEKVIESNIIDSISWDPDINPMNIRITLMNGTVKLDGSVDALWKKYLIEDAAWSHMGVVHVINKIVIVPTGNVVDEVAARRIIEVLDQHRDAEVRRIDVEVSNGVVTLTGMAKSYNEWRTMYNVALYTPGVVDVNDEITIER
jgi:osmotically-inducible protein OsmY